MSDAINIEAIKGPYVALGIVTNKGVDRSQVCHLWNRDEDHLYLNTVRDECGIRLSRHGKSDIFSSFQDIDQEKTIPTDEERIRDSLYNYIVVWQGNIPRKELQDYEDTLEFVDSELAQGRNGLEQDDILPDGTTA